MKILRHQGWIDAAHAIEEPYPEEVFTPMSDDEVRAAVAAMNAAVPYASERLHAAWARHWARVLRDTAAREFGAESPSGYFNPATGEREDA